MKLGAYDYLTKPFDIDKLLQTVDKALETTKLRREVRELRSQLANDYGIGRIIGAFCGGFIWTFGRITATDDFAGSPLYGYYLSNSINGQIRAVLFDGVMTSYPFA